ncbi:MAG: hypothetical protein Ct9H90mP20_7500 [Candidatus Neomarinimicrobiota bacterium]|nr:MAG: hypothetical protein Ct9H90mP20_7500 [Candidatus Neomarinimicrobiota bacterium]
MRDVWVGSYTSPTEFRYIDWILTVPLMCVEFYLLTKTGLSKMISASVVMLVTGYFGKHLSYQFLGFPLVLQFGD